MIAELGLEMSVDILATELEDLLKSRSTTAQKFQEAEEVRKNDKVDDQKRNTQSTPPAASPPPSVIAIADIERSEHATTATATTIQDTKDATLAHIDDKPPAPAVPSPSDPEPQIPSSPSATGADHRALDETATWMPDSSAVQDLPSSLSVASMSMPIDTPLLLLLPAVEKPLSPGKIVTALSSIGCSEDVVQVGAAVVAVLPCKDEEVTPVTAVSIPESDSASPLLMEVSTVKDALFPSDEHDKFSFRPPPVGETNTLLLADEPQPLAPVVDCPSETSPPPPHHHHHHHHQQQQFNILEDSKGSAKEGSDSDDASSNSSDSYFPF